MGIELLDNSNILTTSDCRIAVWIVKKYGGPAIPCDLFLDADPWPFLKAVEVKWPPTKGLKRSRMKSLGALSWIKDMF